MNGLLRKPNVRAEALLGRFRLIGMQARSDRCVQFRFDVEFRFDDASRPSAADVADFFAVIGCGNFYCAAHLVQP